MSQDQLIEIINFWQNNASSKELFGRFIVDKIDVDSKEVIDLIGPRRSGKSSVMKLLIQKIGTNGNWLYLNFEDPFFISNNSPQVIEEAITVFKTHFNSNLKYLFFDEIQNIQNWESAIRKLRDSEQYKIFITGSSAKLLSQELSTLLSGRHLSYQLLPLSFGEFLEFRQAGKLAGSIKNLTINNDLLLKHFSDYMGTGGFPEVVLSKRMELAKQYYNDIVQKDIMSRYDIRDKVALEKIGLFLLSNSAKVVSMSALGKIYNLSSVIVADYVEYFKTAFLFFELPLFSFSLKTQQKALKKIYAIDTGLAGAAAIKFSKDQGRILENIVLLHLKRLNWEIYYYHAGLNEVDFVIKKSAGGFKLIQVAWNLSDKKTQTREVRGLQKAVAELKTDDCLVLTFDTKETIKCGQTSIDVLPVYQWILQGERI